VRSAPSTTSGAKGEALGEADGDGVGTDVEGGYSWRWDGHTGEWEKGHDAAR
jgi:hypothetical protein